MGQYYIYSVQCSYYNNTIINNFLFFVFVQNKCVKISEENVSFLILWHMVFKSQFLPVQLWLFSPSLPSSFIE